MIHQDLQSRPSRSLAARAPLDVVDPDGLCDTMLLVRRQVNTRLRLQLQLSTLEPSAVLSFHERCAYLRCSNL
jgi:hypothetical protein